MGLILLETPSYAKEIRNIINECLEKLTAE